MEFAGLCVGRDDRLAGRPAVCLSGIDYCLQGCQVVGGLLVLADQVGDGALIRAWGLKVFAFVHKKMEKAFEVLCRQCMVSPQKNT